MRFFLGSFAIAVLLFLMPQSGRAAVYQYNRDLGIENISFSKKELFAGDTVRLYARVVNFGMEDEIAYVTFWQGGTAVGNSQPVSVRADGFPDEVFVSYTVPDQPFNIRAVVKGHEAGDQNPANDELVTKLITPIADADRDRVADSADNCPEVANTDQKDTDQDARGDECDDDDDNDGLIDSEENKRGTDSLNRDTDGDGVNDQEDAFPTDPKKSPYTPPTPATTPAQAAPLSPAPEPALVSTSPLSPETDSSVKPSVLETVPLSEEAGKVLPIIEPATRKSADTPSPASFHISRYFKGFITVLLIAAGGLLIAERSMMKKNVTFPEPPQPSNPLPIAAGKPKATKSKKRRKTITKKVVKQDD